MNRIAVLPLVFALTLSACATIERVPVAVSCPPPPPVPSVLTSPASAGPSLSERMENSLQKFEDSLTKAQRQP